MSFTLTLYPVSSSCRVAQGSGLVGAIVGASVGGAGVGAEVGGGAVVVVRSQTMVGAFGNRLGGVPQSPKMSCAVKSISSDRSHLQFFGSPPGFQATIHLIRWM